MANKKELPNIKTLTIMFTDIVGSTAAADKLRREQGNDNLYMETLRKPHDAIIRKCLEDGSGYEVKTIGDSFMAVFDTPQGAIATAASTIECLESTNIQIRVGLHTGTVYITLDSDGKVKDYEGHDVNLAARVESIASGSQVLLSGAVMEISGVLNDYRFHNWKKRQLKGISKPVEIYELLWGDRQPGHEPKGGRTFDYPRTYDKKDFVGRDSSIKNIQDNIESNDLLTIFGIGGVGKTAAAIRACKDIEKKYDVFFAGMDDGLDDKSNDIQIIDKIAKSMKLPDDARKGLAELTAAIRAEYDNAPVLLLIDNYESIHINGFSVIKELINIERLKMLVTSTIRIGTDVEQVLDLEPFVSGDPASRELFELRVRRLPGMNNWQLSKLSDDDRGHVNTILEITNGIPLAIELVASRMDSYTCQKMAESLKESLELIAVREGDRKKQSGPKRHLSMEECLEWSYEKLSKPAQMLFRSVSLLANGFEAELVEKCYGTLFKKKKGKAIQDLLEEIQSSSLINFNDDGKWRFQPIVHRYGKELLNRDKNESKIERDFIKYWDNFVREYSSSDEKVGGHLKLLEKNHGHLIEFLNLLYENELYHDMYIKRANNLNGFWHIERMWGASIHYLKSVLEIAINKAVKGRDKYQPYVAGTRNNLAALLSDMGDMNGAKKLYEEALETCRTLEKEHPAAYLPYVATTCNNLAALLQNMGDMNGAKELYEESLEIRRTLALKYPAAYLPKVASVCDNFAILLRKMGDEKGAAKLSEEAAAARKGLGG
ncbi:MAG: tetratricopeptide repeat protein [Nitrospirae bacterium]|nr:tetratricopeptide repeat protein [Nitrospirota bacterium]